MKQKRRKWQRRKSKRRKRGDNYLYLAVA